MRLIAVVLMAAVVAVAMVAGNRAEANTPGVTLAAQVATGESLGGNIASGADWRWMFTSQKGNLRLYRYNPTTQIRQATEVQVANSSQHVAVTLDATHVRFYVDGVLRDTRDNPRGIPDLAAGGNPAGLL